MAGPNACNSIRSRLSQLASALFVAKIHGIFKTASHETQDASFDAPRRLDLERDDVLPSAAGNAGWTFNTAGVELTALEKNGRSCITCH